jgi:hypothetical protein
MATKSDEAPKSLVLVVGAGASKEVDLPVGGELTEEIRRCLDGRGSIQAGSGLSEQLREALQWLSVSSGVQVDAAALNARVRTCMRIAAAMPQAQSIDHYIRSNGDNPHIAECAKVAIASCILKAEEKSKLRHPQGRGDSFLFASARGTWFNALFQRLAEDCEPKGLEERFRHVAVVSFNYDRCLEHFLYNSLRNYYEQIDEREAARLVSCLEIHHPYGQVGRLPWMAENGLASVPYGAKLDGRTLTGAAKQLRTFSEGVNPALSDINAIRRTICNADRLVFLGFAFHDMNMDLLFGEQDQTATKARAREVYGTAYGMSPSDIADITGTILRHLTPPPPSALQIRDMRCSELFVEFSRSLRFAKRP